MYLDITENTEVNIDDIFDNFDLNILENDSALYPCAAHNMQLIINDCMKSDLYVQLIDKCKSIVKKGRCSTIIANELRQLNLNLKKCNITRWNSTLFMLRSVIKLKSEHVKQIAENYSSNKNKVLEIKNLFTLSLIEKETINELVHILEIFEWVTNELQSNLKLYY